MYNWKSWVWPGIVTTAVLTAGTGWFLSKPVEHDLTVRAGDTLKAALPSATISFDGRDALVTGVAENESLRVKAAELALSTYGVRVVDNTVTLPEIANPFVLSLVKDAKGVTLKGNYDSAESRAKLVAAAETAMPGIQIKDELTLAAGKPAGFDELATFALRQVADLTEGEVNLSNIDYAIKGAAVNVEGYDSILAATTQLPAGGTLKAVDVAVPALGRPYEFGAAIDGDAINLTGYAPSQDVKTALEMDVKAAFPDKTVNNLLKLASGAPGNFAELVKFGLGQMATLGNGSFSLVDASYAIKGIAATAEVFDAVTKQANENLPAGATLGMADLAKPTVAAPAPAAAPYVWSASNAADGLKIEGTAPSSQAALAALDLAKRRFVKTEVIDAQTVLDGAPEEIAAAQANSLKILSYLTAGKAAIADKVVTIEGTAPSESVLKLVKSMAQSGAAGFEFVSKVTVVEPQNVAMAAEVAKPYIWSATSGNDGLKLEGAVLSAAVGASIFDVATSSFAGKAITNAQLPQNPSPAGFADAQAAALKGLALLQQGTASITDKVVRLIGTASSDETKSAAVTLIEKALPDGFSLDAAAVTVVETAPAAVTMPYAWSVSTSAAGVKLDGSAASAEAGAAVLALAQQRFVKTEVMDAQTIAQGAPDGFAEAQAASLKALSYLSEGKAIHSDKSVDITGIAVSENIKALVVRNATAAMPKDYALTTNITVAAPAAPIVETVAAEGDCLTQVASFLKAEQIAFESNRSDILESSSALVGKIAAALASCPDVRVEIAGHTDSDGNDDYNQRLSHDRAHVVRKALVANGVPFERMIAKGYGEKEPIADNVSDENKAKNRRTEFRLIQ